MDAAPKPAGQAAAAGKVEPRAERLQVRKEEALSEDRVALAWHGRNRFGSRRPLPEIPLRERAR